MANRFIAYFDYLGFKDFIMNNPLEYQEKYISHIFRDIENALGREKLKPSSHGVVVANLDDSNIHCINFSDTVIFYTNDDSVESLMELIDVAYIFNWQCINYFFPVRGCLYLGECIERKFSTATGSKGTYSVSSLIGSGLINAYFKAENQSWAGTVIDNIVVEYIEKNIGKSDEFLPKFAKKYRVPYKKVLAELPEEWVSNIMKVEGKLSAEAFENRKKNIIENFNKHNKKTDSAEVIKKIENTILFLKSYT